MYILIVFSVFVASFNSVLLKKAQLSKKAELVSFNLCSALVWCILLFAANKGSLYINTSIVIWAFCCWLWRFFCVHIEKTKALIRHPGSIMQCFFWFLLHR